MLQMLIPLLSKVFVIHHWILKRLENFAQRLHLFFFFFLMGAETQLFKSKRSLFKQTTTLTFDQLLGFFILNYGSVVL